MANTKAKVTINDVARYANVSVATVSRVLNRTGAVRIDTQNKVIEAAAVLGYTNTKLEKQSVQQPSADAPACEYERKIILISLPSISNPFYGQIINGIQAAAQNYDFECLLYPGNIAANNIDSLLEFIRYLHVAGVITANLMPKEVMDKLASEIPVVQCCESDQHPMVSSVSINDFAASLSAMDYILSTGKRRIGLINGPLSYQYARQRRKAYLTAMETARLKVMPHWIIQLPDINCDMAYSSVIKLLSRPDAPNAFFTASDVYAAAAIRAIQHCHLRVPEDVVVVGFDNTDISSLTTPSITTVNQPKFRIGFLSCELMAEKIHNPAVETKHLQLTAELIIRESTVPQLNGAY